MTQDREQSRGELRLNRLMRAAAKSVPSVGNLLEEVLFGGEDIEQAAEFRQSFEQILSNEENQSATVAEILSEVSMQRAFLGEVANRLDQLLAIPESIGPSSVPPALARAAERAAARIPGALPPIWNVPHLRNPHFTGRVSLLNRLYESLTSGETAAVTQAIAGLGGVGKTQLATEYAYRHASEYDIVWWVRSETTATLASDYAALATQLGLPEKDQTDQSIILAAVRLWLGQNTGWLLVLDNAESAEQVRDYIPQGTTGHLLITSRNQIWGTTATPLRIEVFERSESVDFLQARTGADDEDSANALADALGDLPLALEQAAAYIEATGVTLPDYLKLFDEYQQRLLEESKPSDDYPYTVATTWGLSFENVEKESPEGADLLRLLAFFAPDDIPRSLITEGEEHLPESLKPLANDSLALNRALTALRRYSLIEMSEDSYSMHRLMQAVVRGSLSIDETRKYAGTAVNIVDEAFKFEENDLASWHGAARLLSHALITAEHSEELHIAMESTSYLLNGVGKYFSHRADFLAAQRHYERTLRIDEDIFGSDHLRVAASLNELGIILRIQGDSQGSIAYYERAISIAENTHGSIPPDFVATLLSNMGNTMRDSGDLVGARTQFEKSLNIFQETYGDSHIKVGTVLNNLGNLLRDLDEIQGARDHLERALKISEEAFGSEHPSVALSLNNLAIVLLKLRDFESAHTLFDRSFKIYRKFLGDDHISTKTVRRHLELLESPAVRLSHEQAE